MSSVQHPEQQPLPSNTQLIITYIFPLPFSYRMTSFCAQQFCLEGQEIVAEDHKWRNRSSNQEARWKSRGTRGPWNVIWNQWKRVYATLLQLDKIRKLLFRWWFRPDPDEIDGLESEGCAGNFFRFNMSLSFNSFSYISMVYKSGL